MATTWMHIVVVEADGRADHFVNGILARTTILDRAIEPDELWSLHQAERPGWVSSLKHD